MNLLALRFLVVEDHGFERWIAATQLQTLGAQYVFTAADGREALLILEGREPPVDIIVTDLDMPRMDGMEFIRHVAEARYPAALIVASRMEPSLIATVESMARAYGAVVLATIRKPLTAKKLRKSLHGYSAAAKMNDAASTPRFDVEDIASALKRGEFEPFFQAKVESATRETKGAEAIARWRHPRHGLIRPQSFLGPMEETGLIDTLTYLMVEEAARNCRLWRDAGLDVTVSVNLSLKSLDDAKLADRLLSLVDGQHLEPEHLIFELTESAAASDLGPSLENLSRLRMKGFGLSIDDYGTGYSSMERLTRVPFTELKIDQSFVQGASTKASCRAVLESSIEMAQKLGIPAVAEGVETRGEMDLVLGLGAQLVQGYHVARPMDAGEFMSWAKVRQKQSA